MAEQTVNVVSADAGTVSGTVASDEAVPSFPTEAQTETVIDSTEASHVNGNVSASEKAAATAHEEVTANDPDVAGDDVRAASEAADASAPPDSSNKDKKRKSTGGVPEHKSKKLNKKKSMPTLHLDCTPGDFYWARLKGYPPWPSVVCDEAMLPESLLATRPVSTARPDGSIRDDFKPGGKNAKERTFPVMFLATNEFQWMVNTNLTPLDPEECTNPPSTKMSKSLQQAWVIASENHDLQHFKDILSAWQEEEEMFRKQAAEAQAEAERAKAEAAVKAEQEAKEGKPKKKAARKSKGADEDTEMADTETPKSSKKRKKDAESDADGSKPKKTPKVTKLNAPKTPNGEASASKKSSKPKKKTVTAPSDEEEAKPQMTEAERQQQLEKAILYLRHRLQKGFLSRDQAPQESEMAAMADLFTQLEAYENLEPFIIRKTKIHKVLKAIVKLASVPKDDEYNFKKRSSAMLEVWNKRMEDSGDTAPESAVEPKSAVDEKSLESNGETKHEATVAGLSAENNDIIHAESIQDIAEKAEEKAIENADEIEQKLEDTKDAVASPPDVADRVVPLPDVSDAKDTTDLDVSMPPAPSAAAS